MGKSSSHSRNRRRRRQHKSSQPAIHVSSNFVKEAGPGCYIARYDSSSSPDWLLGWELNVDPTEYQGYEVPDIALDPDESTLSLCNLHDTTRVAYITVYDTPLLGKHGRRLTSGISVNEEGVQRSCITLIVLCPPRAFCHLCRIDANSPHGVSLADVELDSDVQDHSPHPNPEDTHPLLLSFPLACRTPSNHEHAESKQMDQAVVDDTSSTTATPSSLNNLPNGYLCTQGEGGELTHFFAGNLHALDFRCDIGTPILAVHDGVVVQVTDDKKVTGVAVSNLFSWNSIMLQLDTAPHAASTTNHEGPLFVEYVHIQSNSASVQVGERVREGQVIARSGSVGFSPEPHLHLCCYRSSDPIAPTVRVYFRAKTNSSNETKFLPQAGKWYNDQGEMK